MGHFHSGRGQLSATPRRRLAGDLQCFDALMTTTVDIVMG
jgi:hypothetical protein